LFEAGRQSVLKKLEEGLDGGDGLGLFGVAVGTVAPLAG
jgi:hypothetical protein